MDKILNNEKPEENMNKLIKMKVLQNIYGPKFNDFIEIFREGSKKAIDIFYQRIKQKINDLNEIKNNLAKKNWNEASKKNFHRSLDHRSFYFKKSEKKITAPSSLNFF